MASKRRMGVPGSAIWNSMLDAAEAILREEGYGALTSRRVAERIGVKQRLVYYYFLTMDDLIVETFRRLATRELERLDKALTSARPLKQLWDVCIHTSDARLISEFMALSHRSADLRTEVIDLIERTRNMQISALKATGMRKRAGALPPAAVAIIATSTALLLLREAALGVKTGHADIMSVISRFIAQQQR